MNRSAVTIAAPGPGPTARRRPWTPMVLALTLLAGACSPAHGPPVRPYTIRFIGPVSLTRTEDGMTVPSYDVETAPSLRFDPAPGGKSGCDPFAGGKVVLDFIDPGGETALSLPLPTTSALFERAGVGFALSPVPAAHPVEDGKRGPAFHFPDRPGAWSLSVTFHCAGSAGRHTVRRAFRCHRNPLRHPGDDPFWKRLAQLSGSPQDMAAHFARARDERADPRDKLWLTRALCHAYQAQGDYDRAEQEAGTWARLAGEAGFPSEAVLAWNAAHEAARDRGDLDTALRYLDRSMAIADNLGYTVRKPENWYSRAELLDRAGRPLLAIEAARKARTAAVANAKRLFATAADLKELELLQALGHHRAVNTRMIRDYAGKPAPLPGLANNVGWLVLRSVEAGMPLYGDRARALDHAETAFREALQGFSAQGRRADRANAMANLAEVAFLRGDLVQAETLLGRSRALAPAGDTTLHLFLLWLDAEISRARGAWDRALDAYDALEREATAAESAEYGGRAAFGAGAVLRARGDLKAAVRAFDRALAWIEEDAAIRSPLHTASLLANRAVWEEAAVLTRLDLGRPLEALQVVERGAWARRRSLSRSARRTRLDPDTRIRVSRLHETLDHLDRRILHLEQRPPTPARARQLREKETLRQARWAELEMLIDAGAPTAPPSVTKASIAGLTRTCTIIRPVAFPHGLVVWTIEADGLHVRRVRMSRSELEASCTRFARTCRTREPDERTGARLAKALIGPERTLPPELVLVTEGPLRQLPWSALPWGSGVLLDVTACRHRLSVLAPRRTSPDGGLPCGMDERPGGEGVLLVADPTRDLPASAEEGERLAARLPGATLLRHEAATRDAVMGRLAGAHLFHFAGHGVTRPLSPYLSHLVLAGGERLGLMEIRAMSLAEPLVFLNACGAGRVADEGGGVLGIADGFAAAGAATVIASRWEVPDETGAAVALAFYRRCLQDQGTHSVAVRFADALRELRAPGPDGAPGLDMSRWSAYLVLEGG